MHRLVIALVTLIGLTGVAVVAAYLFLFAAGTDRAARLAPADSAAYVNVYLQPSTGQQMNLSNLIGRLPGFADEASLDEKVDQIVQNLLSGSGIDYRDEIKPWLGDQVAVAAWPTEGDAASAEAVVIAAVQDREGAEAAIVDLAGGGAETETYDGVELHLADGTAYAFVDEMLVAAESGEALRAVVDVRGDAPSLAEQEAFRQAMSRIPADHLASVYVNPSAAAEVAGAEGQLSGVGPTSAALVAEAEGLRLSGTAPLPESAAASPEAEAETDVASTLPEMMPATAIAELVVFDLASLLREAEAAAGAAPGGEEVTSTLDTLRAVAAFGLGIDIDADILPLLAGEVGLVITGVEGGLPSGQLLLRPDDAEAGLDALDRLASAVGALGRDSRTEEVDGVEITTLEIPDLGEVAYAGTDEVIVIGLGADAVTSALDSGDASLAESEAYERSFALAGTRAGTELWVDVSAAVEALGLDASLPRDARDILSRIGSFGLTAPTRDDHIEFHAVLTVDEP
jgi:hypothetical protein